MKIYPKLADKLKEQKKTYELVTAFAEKLPFYADKIISSEYDGLSYVTLAYQYKTLPLDWGIKWTLSKPTNYSRDSFQSGLVSVYVNSYRLFGDISSEVAMELTKEFSNSDNIYFIDWLNSTFYVTPEQLEEFLERLHNWYVLCKSKADTIRKEQKVKELREQLEQLEKS